MTKEYIEREAVIKTILRQPPVPHYPEWYYRDVKEIPAADVVEVVRCKDCKHAKMHIDIIGDPHLFCCNGRSIYRIKVDLDDFCSYGERKEV